MEEKTAPRSQIFIENQYYDFENQEETLDTLVEQVSKLYPSYDYSFKYVDNEDLVDIDSDQDLQLGKEICSGQFIVHVDLIKKSSEAQEPQKEEIKVVENKVEEQIQVENQPIGNESILIEREIVRFYQSKKNEKQKEAQQEQEVKEIEIEEQKNNQNDDDQAEKKCEEQEESKVNEQKPDSIQKNVQEFNNSQGSFEGEKLAEYDSDELKKKAKEAKKLQKLQEKLEKKAKQLEQIQEKKEQKRIEKEKSQLNKEQIEDTQKIKKKSGQEKKCKAKKKGKKQHHKCKKSNQNNEQQMEEKKQPDTQEKEIIIQISNDDEEKKEFNDLSMKSDSEPECIQDNIEVNDKNNNVFEALRQNFMNKFDKVTCCIPCKKCAPFSDKKNCPKCFGAGFIHPKNKTLEIQKSLMKQGFDILISELENFLKPEVQQVSQINPKKSIEIQVEPEKGDQPKEYQEIQQDEQKIPIELLNSYNFPSMMQKSKKKYAARLNVSPSDITCYPNQDIAFTITIKNSSDQVFPENARLVCIEGQGVNLAYPVEPLYPTQSITKTIEIFYSPSNKKEAVSIWQIQYIDEMNQIQTIGHKCGVNLKYEKEEEMDLQKSIKMFDSEESKFNQTELLKLQSISKVIGLSVKETFAFIKKKQLENHNTDHIINIYFDSLNQIEINDFPIQQYKFNGN